MGEDSGTGTIVQFDAPAMRSALAKIVRRANDAFGRVLPGEAAALISEANAAVPVESGELKASSFTSSGLTAKGNTAATAGYEDEKAPAVHEGFHGGKQIETPNRFWLQTVANRFAPGFARRMASTAKWVFG